MIPLIWLEGAFDWFGFSLLHVRAEPALPGTILFLAVCDFSLIRLHQLLRREVLSDCPMIIGSVTDQNWCIPLLDHLDALDNFPPELKHKNQLATAWR